MITATKTLEGLDDLRLDDDAKTRFLAGSAARVFGINQHRCPAKVDGRALIVGPSI